MLVQLLRQRGHPVIRERPSRLRLRLVRRATNRRRERTRGDAGSWTRTHHRLRPCTRPVAVRVQHLRLGRVTELSERETRPAMRGVCRSGSHSSNGRECDALSGTRTPRAISGQCRALEVPMRTMRAGVFAALPEREARHGLCVVRGQVCRPRLRCERHARRQLRTADRLPGRIVPLVLSMHRLPPQ